MAPFLLGRGGGSPRGGQRGRWRRPLPAEGGLPVLPPPCPGWRRRGRCEPREERSEGWRRGRRCPWQTLGAAGMNGAARGPPRCPRRVRGRGAASRHAGTGSPRAPGRRGSWGMPGAVVLAHTAAGQPHRSG